MLNRGLFLLRDRCTPRSTECGPDDADVDENGDCPDGAQQTEKPVETLYFNARSGSCISRADDTENTFFPDSDSAEMFDIPGDSFMAFCTDAGFHAVYYSDNACEGNQLNGETLDSSM
eukprot:SAG11_NODE_3824_length_2206_cov_3.097295_1_plen_117_part_10